MRIKMYIPEWFVHDDLDCGGWLQMDEGATLRQALRTVHCGPVQAKLLMASVNGKRAPLSEVLHDGDVVSLFSIAPSG